MVGFVIWTRIERCGARHFVAKATAIPWDVEQRSAPEERSVSCTTLEKAQAARVHLASELTKDIVARGNRIVDQVRDVAPPGPASPGADPCRAQRCEARCG